MAKKSTARSTAITSGDAAMVIVIRELDGYVYLDPKPTRQRVKVGRTLLILAINLTSAAHDVEAVFQTPIVAREKGQGSKKPRLQVPSLQPGEVDYLPVKISTAAFQGVPKAIKVIGVQYAVKVDGVSVIPISRSSGSTRDAGARGPAAPCARWGKPPRSWHEGLSLPGARVPPWRNNWPCQRLSLVLAPVMHPVSRPPTSAFPTASRVRAAHDTALKAGPTGLAIR